MQPEKVTHSGAVTTDALPVHEAGMANTAQRGPAYHNPAMYRVFDHELGKELFDGLDAKDNLGVAYFNPEASAGGLGAGRGVDLLGGLNHSPTNEPGTFAHQAGLGAGRGWDLRREDPTNDPGADLVGLGVLPPTASTDVPAGAVNYNSELLGKNLTGELGAPYANATMSSRETGMPFAEVLVGKNYAAELGAPYANAPMSMRDPGMPLREALLGKNCVAGLDAPYSNAAVFAHQLGMTAGEALRATPASPYAVQVFTDEAIGAKAGGPIAVGAKAASADAGDARGRASNLSAVVGIVAASSAVTVAAAGAVSPAVAFGSFLLLLGGLSLAVSTVHGV